MNDLVLIVEQELHVVHESEEPRSVLNVKVVRFLGYEARPGSGTDDGKQSVPGILDRGRIGEWLDPVFCIRALCGNTVR